MWHKQSFTQFWSQSDAYSRRSSLKLTYIHHPLVVCTHQICCAVAVPIALSQDRLLHGHNRLVNWTPCSRMRESKLKTIRHLICATSSFLYHFIAIGQFKLELQSGNSQFRSKSMIFRSPATLKVDGWSWKTIGQLFHAISSFVCHFTAISQSKLELQYRKPNLGQNDFLSRATLIFDRWPWKIIGYLFYATSSFVRHFIAICEIKLELQSGNAQIGTNFVLTSVTLTSDLDLWHGHHFCQW